MNWDAVEAEMVRTLIASAQDGDAASARKVLDYAAARRTAEAPPPPAPVVAPPPPAKPDRSEMPTRDRAVDHMATTGDGYKATARALCPDGTSDVEYGRLVRRCKDWRRWGITHKRIDPARVAAPLPAAEVQPLGTVGTVDAADPNSVHYWSSEVRGYAAGKARAVAGGQMKTAAEFGRLEAQARSKLEEARKLDAVEAARRERESIQDPAELARLILEQVPLLLRLCPVEAKKIGRKLLKK